MFTRESVEGTSPRDRPLVRCRYECDFINEDGRTTSVLRDAWGRILTVWYEDQPWIEIHAGGRQIAERFLWEDVLMVLNDHCATPIYFKTRVEYEV